MAPTVQQVLEHAGPGLVGLGIAGLVHEFVRMEPLEHPAAGRRAEQRRAWQGLLGGLVDGTLRRAGAMVRPLLADSQRARLDTQLEQGGDFLGVCAEELIVMSLASGLLLGWLAVALLPGGMTPVLGLAVGAVLPAARLSGRATDRVRAADRELPAAIDLIAMCMAAGLDFPRAVGLVADNPVAGAVLPGELSRLVGEMQLGSTRRASLQRLARRLPARGIQDFVAAAVQAEQKGTPLALVLEAQAGMSRMRRSVAAEEAASRAGVLLLVPLMLLMGCIVLLLVGPFLAGGGFG